MLFSLQLFSWHSIYSKHNLYAVQIITGDGSLKVGDFLLNLKFIIPTNLSLLLSRKLASRKKILLNQYSVCNIERWFAWNCMKIIKILPDIGHPVWWKAPECSAWILYIRVLPGPFHRWAGPPYKVAGRTRETIQLHRTTLLLPSPLSGWGGTWGSGAPLLGGGAESASNGGGTARR